MGGGQIVEVVRTVSASQRDTFMVAINQEFENEVGGGGGGNLYSWAYPSANCRAPHCNQRRTHDGCRHYEVSVLKRSASG